MSERRDQMQIANGELARLTSELDQLHSDVSMPAMRAGVARFLEDDRLSRRRFLVGSGVAVAGVALAACGSSGKKSSSASTTTSPGAGPHNLTGDLQVAAMAASLEILGAQTYQAALVAAQQNKLGPSVPAAVATFAQTVMSQHQQHAAAWNSILTGAGKTKVTQPDAKVKPDVDKQFATVKDVPGLARLALGLENVAAATYLNAIGIITADSAIGIAASIQPVEMQHAAILHFVLGEYPVPDAFAKTDGARPPSDYS